MSHRVNAKIAPTLVNWVKKRGFHYMYGLQVATTNRTVWIGLNWMLDEVSSNKEQ